jgi:hypothetical protein
MTSDENNPLNEADDLNTTAPNPPPDVWRMPEPVFRRTSGKLPRGFVKTGIDAGEGEPEPAAPGAEEDVTDEQTNDSVEAYAETKPKNPTLKLLLVVLGVAAMIAFIVVFLTVIYFFFWRSSPGPLG